MISVLVPVYNSEKYLSDCIESILNQTYEDFELILLDDGSTDGSYNIMEKFKDIDGRVKIFHKDNEKSVSKTRNKLLNLISGEYFVFIDSDDEVDEKFLEILYKTAIETESDITACGFDVVKRKPVAFEGQNIEIVDAKTALITMCFGGRFYAVWNKLIRTAILKDVKFDEQLNYGEDLVFFFDILSANCKFTFIKNKLYHYKMRSGSLSTGKFGESKKQFLKKIIEMSKDEKYNNIQDILKVWVYCTAKLFRYFTRNRKRELKEYRFYLKSLINEYKPYYKNSKYVPYLYKSIVAFLSLF